MNKSTILARCLINMEIGIYNLQEAEAIVETEFYKHFPKEHFNAWNTYVDDSVARNIINNVGKASEINPKSFILDLWE